MSGWRMLGFSLVGGEGGAGVVSIESRPVFC